MLPSHRLTSAQRGPTVLITGGVHGDEVTGLAAIQALIPKLEQALDHGRVQLYPSLNPAGLEAGTRTVPEDGADLNRHFPGARRGVPTAKLAHCLWQHMEGHLPELLIDLHADSGASIPYCIVDRHLKGSARLTGQCQQLAEATGLTVLMEYPRKRYAEYGLERSLSGAALNLWGIPSLTLEAGPRLRVDPDAVEAVVQAVMGVLGMLGMVPAAPSPHPTRLEGGPWRREAGPRLSHDGLLVPKVLPGQSFRRGQLLAEVRSLEGRLRERLLATRQGAVISLPETGWALAGSAAGTYAVAEEA
ncbi:MAG: succinylglutamate desuccinylase/aspartoacylase family protein [Myxococcota bacterium]|nr:succinylglutamate desuccinylase/aspartoacylase family protein [Myxococcota bacterium]